MTAAIGTGRIVAGASLSADVLVLRETKTHYEVQVTAGTGGWNSPGKRLTVQKHIMISFTPITEGAAVVPLRRR